MGQRAIGITLRHLGSVFKLRISVAITLSALAGMLVQSGPVPASGRVALLALVVMMASASAGALNQYLERDLDARMRRTRRRPFVTGEFAASGAWVAAILGLLVLAEALAAGGLGPLVALYLFLGAFTYGIVYTVWLKRRSWLNIVVGGLSGSFAVLAGAAAVAPQPSVPVMLLALVWFLWTPPHFWALATVLADDYAAAGIPMLPVVMGPARSGRIILGNTVLLVAVSLLPLGFGMGWPYLAGAVAGGGYFIWRAARLARDPSRATARAAFLASLVQLGLLMAGALADHWLR